MICKKCGQEIADDSVFCIFCGEKNSVESAQAPTDNQNNNNNYNQDNNQSYNNYNQNHDTINTGFNNVSGVNSYVSENFPQGNINDKINAYNKQIIKKKKGKKKLIIIVAIIGVLIVAGISILNSKFGAYTIGKMALGMKNYEWAKSKFKVASGYSNADVYYNFLMGEENYNNGKYETANSYYEKCFTKVRTKPNEYKELSIKDISDKMNYGICKKYDNELNDGKLYDAYKTLYQADDDYVYNGTSVHDRMVQLYGLKNYIEMMGNWQMTKNRCDINPRNRYMNGWYNNSIGGSISISKIKDGVIYIDYYLPFLEKYSSIQSGLEIGSFSGTTTISANDCNKWLTVSKYSSSSLKIYVNNINRKINMAFAYPLVFTSYGSVLDGTTKGDYESTCTTLISNFMKDGWIGDYYYQNGTKLKNTWAKYGNDWYYLGSDGGYIVDKWVDNNEYYVGSDGKMLKNTTAPDGTKLDGNGKRKK